MLHTLGMRVHAGFQRLKKHWDTVFDRPPARSEQQRLLCVAGYLAESRACWPTDPAEATKVAIVAEDLHGYGPDERRASIESIEARALKLLDTGRPERLPASQ